MSQVTGEWKGKSAGGCGNYPQTNQFNPIYQVTLDGNTANNHLLVELRAPRSVGVVLSTAVFIVLTVYLFAFEFPMRVTDFTTMQWRYFLLIWVDNISSFYYKVFAAVKSKTKTQGPPAT